VRWLIRKYKALSDEWGTFLAGCLGGVSIVFWKRDSWRILSLYVFARFLQSAWRSARNRGWVKKYLGIKEDSWIIQHGDFHVFAFFSAQIMYSYVMHPDSLVAGFWGFIVKCGPISPGGLAAVKGFYGKGVAGVDVAALQKGIAANPKLYPGDASIIGPILASLPAGSIRIPDGHTTSILPVLIKVFAKGFAVALPMYLSLQVVPSVVLRLGSVVRSPVSTAAHLLLNATRSACFLASFPTTYQAVILACQSLGWVGKGSFWFAGWIASLSLLIERSSRRGELALYTLPRGADSLFRVLKKRGWPINLVPGGKGEVLLFCVGMGGLSYFYHYEREVCAPLFTALYGSVVAPDKKHRDVSVQASGQGSGGGDKAALARPHGKRTQGRR